MCIQMRLFTNAFILAGASALVGCALIQTTEEYALSHGYRPIEIQDREYFCRRERVGTEARNKRAVRMRSRPVAAVRATEADASD